MKASSRAQKHARLRMRAHQTLVPAHTDVCVIGAGAAGMVAGICAAEAGARVVVLETKLEAAQTILATGNGRCNFANVSLAPKYYNHPEFVAEVCGASWLEDILQFWRECGLRWSLEDDRLYPLSRQAASVRNVLLTRAARAGVIVACGRKVEHIALEKSFEGKQRALETPVQTNAELRINFIDQTSDTNTEQSLTAKAVISAVGGGAAAGIARDMGLQELPYSPVLAPLACHDSPLAALSGRRSEVIAQIYHGEFPQMRERGEVLLRDYGISGIVCFDLSRYAEAGDIVTLDFAPDCNLSELRQIADPTLSGKLIDGCLDGVLDPLIAQSLIQLAREGWTFEGDTRADAPSAETQSDPLSYALALTKAFPLRIAGIAHPELAQVTRGGLAVDQFERRTLAALSVPQLFACGEALDIDAACGGFNLAWAWKSGMVAGEGAARYASVISTSSSYATGSDQSAHSREGLS